jgi:hypothetical protein
VRIPRSVALVTTIAMVLIVASTAAYIYSSAPPAASCSATYSCGGSANSKTTSTSSVQAENHTIVAAYASTLAISATNVTTTISTTTPAETTTTMTTPATATQSASPEGVFTYSSSSQVKILSVSALISQMQSGARAIGFSVQFENVASAPIYVLSGGGSSLSVTSLTGTPVTSQPLKFRCEVPVAMTAVNPGGNHTSSTPGCWSGYTYLLSQPGTIEVQLILTWSNASSQGGQQGSIEITAEFTLN